MPAEHNDGYTLGLLLGLRTTPAFLQAIVGWIFSKHRNIARHNRLRKIRSHPSIALSETHMAAIACTIFTFPCAALPRHPQLFDRACAAPQLAGCGTAKNYRQYMSVTNKQDPRH
mmetsp:Transcript_34833/g.64834  ORF Transcript_34833/g.64834 Transcript_34833/m.64834 type:complete len:115 (-) Transcript_34833:43-387(-)